ncbi:hypothetical protein GPECTOR_11g45 [Gonium pectorale]|uniref:FAD-binding domain-containing protein n=1 Tax=Gonium pectorale TaxID=33097 RepID=A0A150GQ97_GONPE|nr:hypothetical protein GPECTOR_11g45 [Gonium pectorale]|eukprot:KXZ51918.1 hypothetical protein GPECTOR_11g45 [Gonium pectorale]
MIELGPNGFAALGELHEELPARLKHRGVLNLEARYRFMPPGRESRTITRDASQSRTYTIRWAETQDALAELVPPEVIHCDHAATGYDEIWDEQDEQPAGGGGGGGPGPAGRPASRAVVHFRSQPSVTARLVVGADGVFSAVRAAMFPGDPGPRYLGHMNWNCVFPNPGGNTVVDAHKPGQLLFAADGRIGDPAAEPTLMLVVSDAGGDHTFWQVRAQSEAPDFTAPPDRPPGEAGGDGHAADSRAAVQGRGGASGGPGGRRGRGGMGVPGSKARVIQRIKSAGWDWAVPILEAVPESCLFERALYDRLPLERWSSRGGRVVLLGDSAHAMHPGPGQGARSAFEDAHQLVLAVEALWPDVPSALERYQRARIVRATRVQLLSAEYSGLEAVREAARPAGLSQPQLMERRMEFRDWFDQYPANMDGDPESTWWKPPSS